MIQLNTAFSFAGPNYALFYPNYWTPFKAAKDILVVMHSKVLVGDVPRLVTSMQQHYEEYGDPAQNFPHAFVVPDALHHGLVIWVLTVAEDEPLDVALWKLADSSYEHASYLTECLNTFCPRKGNENG